MCRRDVVVAWSELMRLYSPYGHFSSILVDHCTGQNYSTLSETAEYFECAVDYFKLFINLVIGVIMGKLEIESYQNERIGVSQIRDTGKKTEKSENGYEKEN